jgi:hypothetical protein
MNPNQRPRSGQQARVSHHARNADSFAFFNLLTGPQLLDRVEAQLPGHRERTFPPTETLSMFLAQVLSADGRCQQALDDVLVKRVVAGLEPGSTDTGTYCKARARLPLSMVSTPARETGALVAGETPPWWRWRGRRVRRVDGTTMTLADTPENQAEYPQPASRKQGLGFPVLCLVVVLCLATGALIDAAMGPCEGKGSSESRVSLVNPSGGSCGRTDSLLGGRPVSAPVRPAPGRAAPRRAPEGRGRAAHGPTTNGSTACRMRSAYRLRGFATRPLRPCGGTHAPTPTGGRSASLRSPCLAETSSRCFASCSTRWSRGMSWSPTPSTRPIFCSASWCVAGSTACSSRSARAGAAPTSPAASAWVRTTTSSTSSSPSGRSG